MKLNNKGITIVELIVSISLISVVMLFMYRLLADVTFQKDNDYIATANQEQRIEIINNIQKEIGSSEEIASIYADGKKIKFKNGSNSVIYTIEVKEVLIGDKPQWQVLLYKRTVLLKQWKIKGAFLSNPTCSSEIALSTSKLKECTIEVYTENINNQAIEDDGEIVDNNNTLDDLVFSFKY